MTCMYLGKDPMRCTLKGGGEEQYEKNQEFCNEKFQKCPWIKESMSKEEFTRFQMMWGFFK
ncbi:MAG: hypothetical protein SVM80_09000 [Halobacteriota archaeon]|nr:hypothetical protein [Halobacteriota archaeon]